MTLRTILPAAHLLTLFATGATLAQYPVDPPSHAWFPKAPPLPEPAGQVIRVTNVDELFRAADEVGPDGTILLADGHYKMPRYFDLHTDNVTLRGASGRRENVVLDGAESRHGELVGVTGCSGVTIADLTIQNIKWNGFKINSNRRATRVTIHNCIIHNIWQRGVKGVGVPKEDRQHFRPSDCRIRYCLFYNDRPKQYSDDPADTPENFHGNYIGGIDVMYPKGWTISDNVFIGIQGRTREARGAVFLWHDAQECIVERNVFIDNDSGICLGNSHRGAETQIHCTRCTVRNNFITRCPEQGILADYTRDCQILHNTIHDPDSRLKRLIRLVHDNDGLQVANNLLSGPPMRVQTTSRVHFQDNLTGDRTADFVDPASGNLHLRGRVPEVVDAARPLANVTRDFDRRKRDERPDVGGHEFAGSGKR